MENEVLNSFSKFRLGTEEEEGVVLLSLDVRKCIEDCERSILGKVWGLKTAKFMGVKKIFTNLWSQKGDLRVEELGSNFFQFFFTDQEEKERVLHRRPWFFENQILVLQPWRKGLRESDLSFKNRLCGFRLKGFLHIGVLQMSAES